MSSNKTTKTDDWALRFAQWTTSHRWWAIGLTVLLTVAAATGIGKLEFSNNYRVFFSPENPDLVAFEHFQDTYTKNDNILFVLQPAEGEVFEGELLAGIEWLTAAAWKIPHAIRVDAVTNYQHSWADGDDLTVEDLVRNGAQHSPEYLAARRDVALAEPLLVGSILAADARTTGINVTLQYPELSLEEVPAAVGEARALAAEMRERFPDLTVALTGVSMLNNAFAEAGQKDAGTLMPGMFAALVVLMLIVLRSVSGTLGTLFVISFSALTALGVAGHMGIKLNPINLTAPVIIMTLGIADSVHLLITALQRLRAGSDKLAAIRESVRVNALPVVITSVTTVIGFLSLNFSDAPPFRELGNITAIGIVAAMIHSLVFLPAFLSLVRLRAPRGAAGRSGLQAVMGRLADFVIHRHRAVLATTGVLALVLIASVPLIQLNDEFVKYFDHRVEFRGDAEWAMDNLTGIYLVEFSLPAAGEGGISEPEYLDGLERFTSWLRGQPEVRHVYSYADVIKRLNRNLHGDDPTYHTVPADRELAAQYLLLYELSLPYGLDLNDRISIDKDATRVTATISEMPTGDIRAFLDRAQEWLAVEAPDYMQTRPTGASVMFSFISQRNIESMLRGNLMAVALIAVVMVGALRSVRLGALSLVPNLVPILMTFGVWALLVRQVGMAAATVTATSLGIVVDDSVHFLTKYLRARREQGLDQPGAIRYAFETVGSAMVSTTVILSVGFAVLAFSTFRINNQMGLLTSIAVVLALAIDLLLLPALLMIGHRVRKPENRNMKLKLSKSMAAMLVVVLAGTATLPAIATAPTDDPVARGFAIAERSDSSDRGFGDSVVELRMILRNAAGSESTRRLLISTLEIPDIDQGDKSLVLFDSPADIEGTALLSHAQILDPDDQWLYLPALKRVKRISSVNKSGPFVGSEFAFEDFTALELGKYSYRWLGEEEHGGMLCDVVERTPAYEHSGYSRQVSWIDQTDHQVRQVEFYDRRGDLLKTLRLEDYRLYDGGVWRTHRMHMVNHQTGKETDMVYGEYAFGTGLEDRDFVRGALERAR